MRVDDEMDIVEMLRDPKYQWSDQMDIRLHCADIIEMLRRDCAFAYQNVRAWKSIYEKSLHKLQEQDTAGF